MSDNEENIKVKLSLNNLLSRTENKMNPSHIPSESNGQNISPAPRPASEPSLTGNQEGLKLKLKIPGTKLPEIEERKNIPIQDIKLKPIKNTSVTADKKGISLQLSPKSSEQASFPSNYQTEHKAEETLSNFVDTQEEKNQKITLKKEAALEPDINLSKINIRKPEEPSFSQEEEKNTNKMYDSIGNITTDVIKSKKEKIKYFFIAGAVLVVIIILLYLMISTINTLMTI